MKDSALLATLLLQIAAIIALSRVMGVLFARMRQPQVIGEMLAGIMLGPSILGLLWPDGYAGLFPPETVRYLNVLAQVGIVLFLFLVGLEFDPSMVRHRGKTAAIVSTSSVVVPLAMGIALAYLIHDVFGPAQQANMLPSALFLGAAISVTAFPVLARIIAERNLQRTTLGALAITSAAVNDVLAWVMLAIVVAVVDQNGTAPSPLFKLLVTGAYLLAMLLVIRPLLKQLQRLFDAQGKLTHTVAALVFLTILLSAAATERIGVHALFGAFVAGLVMPKGSTFVRSLTERLEDFTIVFLLPIFFAYAGLRADLTSVFSGQYVGYTLLIIGVACLGKIGGAAGAARLCGVPGRDALGLGILMNTRGLMELIILTVGLQLEVINTTVYGMMVVMALVTTAMTAPLLALIRRGGVPDAQRPQQDDKIFTVLLPVARPETGGPLLELSSYVANTAPKHRIVALHLDRMSGAHLYRGTHADVLLPSAAESLAPLMDEAKGRGIAVEPQSYFSRDVPSDIARVSRFINSDLILIGHHTPVFGGALLGGVVHRVMTGADCDLGVFVERDFSAPKRILVPFLNSLHDKLALDLAGRIARSTGAAITIIHVTHPDHDSIARQVVDKTFNDPTQKQAVHVKIIHSDDPEDVVLQEVPGHDLVVIGVAEEWGLESSLLGLRAERIAAECPTSLLIVRKFVAPAS